MMAFIFVLIIKKKNKTNICFTEFDPSLNKVATLQHPTATNENYIGNLPNYVIPPPQGITHAVPTKNPDIQCSQYIMPTTPVDYTAPNLQIWDPYQIPPNVQNGISNSKKVNNYE